MPTFVVVHGSVRYGQNKAAGIGEPVELTEEEGKRLIADGIVVEPKKFDGLKKQAEGAVEAGADLLKLDKAVRNLAGLAKSPAKAEAKPEAKPDTKPSK